MLILFALLLPEAREVGDALVVRGDTSLHAHTQLCLVLTLTVATIPLPRVLLALLT